MNRLDHDPSDFPPLARRGPHKIGVRTLDLVNPDQVDVVQSQTHIHRYDRPIRLELWYPALPETTPGTTYQTLLRDGHTPVFLQGQARRDAPRLAGDWPLVILSHGYPGNRFLMGHLGEKLASQGYVVASLDHADSTYDNKAALASTLVNRTKDTAFVAASLGDWADTTRYAIIGYSMGGYGALVAGGAAIAPKALATDGAPAHGLWDFALDPTVAHGLKAIIPIGPWGRQRGLWDKVGMAGLRVPMFLMAGSADVISGYETGMRLIFEEAVNTSRHLLTFEGAGHNAAAPYPAPAEAFLPSPHLDFLPAEHYADLVWNTQRMNGIAQHYARAFLDLHLKGDRSMTDLLDQTLNEKAPGANRGLQLERLAP
jgi:predicted dienelactone hydrolase